MFNDVNPSKLGEHMALPKPEKSKAPAVVQPAGGWPNSNVTDPCCIPAGAGAFDPFVAATGSDGVGDPNSAVALIMDPGAH
jgi:hypothetical protein